MTDTNGAIDHQFEDAERSPQEQIEAALADVNREPQAGDVVIDLVYHRPMYVKGVEAATCYEYWEYADFDLTTYKAHPYLPVEADDTVLTCVYIPTKPGDVTHDRDKGKSYDFPAGRLMRVPLELIWGGDVTPNENLKRACVAALLATAESVDQDVGDMVEVVHAVARAAFGDDTAFDAAERAGIPVRDGDEDGTEDGDLGDFDGGAE